MPLATNPDESLNVYPLPEMVFLPIHEWEEEDIVIVLKDQAAWQALNPEQLNWDIGTTLDVPAASEAHYKKLVQRCDGMGEILYAVGGGVVVDAAKYVANALDMALICIPTALSVDAFWTWNSAVRENGCVRFIETLPPEIVLLDFDVIARAPAHVRAAGIIDLLSIATACFDWELAEQRSRNPIHEKYDEGTARIAQAILRNALDCAEAAGQGDAAGLHALAKALAMEVQLCNLAFHGRAEEGSEHYFAYCAEDIETQINPATRRTHAEYVGPGIVQMAHKQGQAVEPLQRALAAAGVPMNLPTHLVEQTLQALPNYVRQHKLPYGVAWE
jgi:glycerol-1-phosphate dehydrogenase [NAD(P)+]